MIIFLYGEDTFRSRQKLKELKDKFTREADTSGGSIVNLAGESLSVEALSEAVGARSLFARKRMIIIENVFNNKSDKILEKVFDYFKKQSGKKEKTIAAAVSSFLGLEHRIEPVGNIKGVLYYNDSFATTPESAIIALNSFHQPIILLAGGAEKNSNFKELAKTIKKKVKFLVLFKGDSTPRIKAEVEKAGFSKNKIKVVNIVTGKQIGRAHV